MPPRKVSDGWPINQVVDISTKPDVTHPGQSAQSADLAATCPPTAPLSRREQLDVVASKGGLTAEMRQIRKDVAALLDEAMTYEDADGLVQDHLIDAMSRGVKAGDPQILRLVAAYRWGKPIARIEIAGEGGQLKPDLLSEEQLLALVMGTKKA